MFLRTNWRWIVGLIGAFTVGVFTSSFFQPAYRSIVISLTKDRYADLVFECDSAMRSHLFAKLVFDQEPSELNVQSVKSTEIGLLSCQDYDLYQKRLLRFGLEEEDLGFMRLWALEERGADLQQVVAEHEFRY